MARGKRANNDNCFANFFKVFERAFESTEILGSNPHFYKSLQVMKNCFAAFEIVLDTMNI